MVQSPVRPTFVYLDMGNVLVRFDQERAFRQMAAAGDADVAAIRAAVLEGGLQEALERGRIDWPEFHAVLSQRTGNRADAAALAHAAADMFSLNVEMLPVIAGLERTGCGLGILSNTCGPHWEHLVGRRFAVLPGNFREIVLSHEVRAVKPEPEIFATATRRAGVAAEQIFFCDDTPGHVEAARRAGWQAEVFTSAAGLVDALDRRGLKLGL
jgi:FMN phosphatase YigB (HAD superfamily)